MTTAPQWVRVAARMMRSSLVSLAWFWAVCLFAGVVVTVVLDWRLGEPPFSIMSAIRYGGIWYPFSVFLILVAATLNVHVAAGQTRRSFLIGTLLNTALYGLVNGVVMAVVLQVERGIYLDQGWSHAATSEAALPTDWGASLAFHCLVFLAGGISGLLVGLSYYRWGGWATVALPLTALPAALASGLDPTAITVAALAVTSVGAAVACYVLGRTIAIRRALETS